MTAIVISDTHGKYSRISEVLSKHISYDALLFLGDGLTDLRRIDPPMGLCAVRGNCDGFMTDAPNELMLDLGGYKILLMHGHTHGVKNGVERALAYACSRSADILIHGHTHVASERYYPAGTELAGVITPKPLYCFCPGSLGSPRSGPPSYGVLQIRGGSVLFSFGKL